MGKVGLKIPPDSQAGKKLRLKGRGIPAKTPGDLYVVVQITLPPADSDKARAAYKRLKEDLEFDARATMEVV